MQKCAYGSKSINFESLLEEYIGLPINLELIMPGSVLSKIFSCCGQVFAETISVTKTNIKFKELKDDMRERVATDRQLEFLKQKIVSSLSEYHHVNVSVQKKHTYFTYTSIIII